jgi:hypothetical protein
MVIRNSGTEDQLRLTWGISAEASYVFRHSGTSTDALRTTLRSRELGPPRECSDCSSWRAEA